MHRSGTSLMASYFEHCGINMGENLIGAMRGNERGHFEDADYVLLHDDILSDNHCHMYSPKKQLNITDARKDQARNIIKDKPNRSGYFGWKDPRSSIFLNFWHQIDPSIKFVLLYRDPFTVIDSLRRRGTDKRIHVFPWLPTTAWLRYNSDLLNFHKKPHTETVIINIDGFNSNCKASVKVLESWIGKEMNKPYTDIYHKEEFTSSNKLNKLSISSLFDSYYRERLHNLYSELENEALVSSSYTA